MATRKPIVLVEGEARQLPPGDRVAADLDYAEFWLTENYPTTSVSGLYPVAYVVLPAGTWFVSAHVLFVKNATGAATPAAFIHRGSGFAADNCIASAQAYHPSVSGVSVNLAMSGVVVLTEETEIRLIVTPGASSASAQVRWNTVANLGKNATGMTAIRLK